MRKTSNNKVRKEGENREEGSGRGGKEKRRKVKDKILNLDTL